MLPRQTSQCHHRQGAVPCRPASLDAAPPHPLIELTSRPDGRCRDEGFVARPLVEESPGSMEIRWRLTAAGGDPRESATENRPPCAGFGRSAARVKRCGKSAPRVPATGAARQTPPGARPNRGGRVRGNSARRPVSRPATRVGCSRRPAMAAPDEWPSRRETSRQNPAYRPAGCYGGGPAKAAPVSHAVSTLLQEPTPATAHIAAGMPAPDRSARSRATMSNAAPRRDQRHSCPRPVSATGCPARA